MPNLPNRSFFDTWARIRGHRAKKPPSLYDDPHDLMAPHALSLRRGSHRGWKRQASSRKGSSPTRQERPLDDASPTIAVVALKLSDLR